MPLCNGLNLTVNDTRCWTNKTWHSEQSILIYFIYRAKSTFNRIVFVKIHYICEVFSHWLWPYQATDRTMWQYTSNQKCVNLLTEPTMNWYQWDTGTFIFLIHQPWDMWKWIYAWIDILSTFCEIGNRTSLMISQDFFSDNDLVGSMHH